ncbi:unnamed protein product [Boreogadus saida]
MVPRWKRKKGESSRVELHLLTQLDGTRTTRDCCSGASAVGHSILYVPSSRSKRRLGHWGRLHQKTPQQKEGALCLNPAVM